MDWLKAMDGILLLLGGGTLAALVRNWLLHRASVRRQMDDFVQELLESLHRRVAELERSYHACMEENLRLRERLGGLQEALKRLEAGVPAVSLLLDEDGYIVDWPAHAENFFHISCREILNEHVSRLIPGLGPPENWHGALDERSQAFLSLNACNREGWSIPVRIYIYPCHRNGRKYLVLELKAQSE